MIDSGRAMQQLNRFVELSNFGLTWPTRSIGMTSHGATLTAADMPIDDTVVGR